MLELFSVDDHVIEPADVWSARVPAKYRDAAPHVIEEDGREFWVYEDQRSLTMGLNSVAGKPRETWGIEPTRFSDMIPGSYDPKERSRDLLANGILASVNFPSLPGFGGRLFAQFKDKELATECVRAWNDFILDEWVPGGPPGLFVPMVICQLWNPAGAAAEIRRCVDKGAKALCFVENPVPLGLPSFWTDAWDLIWGTAAEAGIPVCMHVGSSGYTPISSTDSNFLEPIAIGMIGALMGSINLMLAPPAYKFPNLKLVWSEGGIGWIPAALERADRQFERHHYWAKTGDLKPSEIFRRNMWVCMIEEPIGLSFREHVGVDKILWESDYPHADTTWPFAQKAAQEVFAGVPDDEVEAITHRNAEHLFGWTMADPALVSSPDVASWSATLAADPYAAMARRHDLEGVEHAGPTTARPGDPCRQTVQDNNMYKACGLPIGADGSCAAGHVTALTAA
jgi:predicted TIM-barrel fold metal-dependent hydrolase